MGTLTVIMLIYRTERMRLTKLLNYANVQHYLIENPSAKFKRKYPKRFIYAFREGTQVIIGNEDKLPTKISFHKLPGYIFTYSKVSLSNVFVNIHYPPEQESTRYPTIENLDRVFVKGNDIAISLIHDKISPIGMPVDAIDMSFSIKDFLKTDNNTLIKTITNAYVEFVKGAIHNTEAWVELILELVPLTRFERVPSFPAKIDDNSFKEDSLRKSFKFKDLYLTYDVHAHNNEEEFKVAHKMDTLMIDPSFNITVEEDYGGLATRLKKLIKKPVKSTDSSITFTIKQYCDINDGEFTIIDCI